MFTMKQACEQTQLPYETLKFYCNQGLVPNVKRDKNNRRIFDERDISWIKSLNCLKNCGMSISEMKEYINLCLAGKSTIHVHCVFISAYSCIRMFLFSLRKAVLEAFLFPYMERCCQMPQLPLHLQNSLPVWYRFQSRRPDILVSIPCTKRRRRPRPLAIRDSECQSGWHM